jgi:hypothetical protein
VDIINRMSFTFSTTVDVINGMLFTLSTAVDFILHAARFCAWTWNINYQHGDTGKCENE